MVTIQGDCGQVLFGLNGRLGFRQKGLSSTYLKKHEGGMWSNFANNGNERRIVTSWTEREATQTIYSVRTYIFGLWQMNGVIGGWTTLHRNCACAPDVVLPSETHGLEICLDDVLSNATLEASLVPTVVRSWNVVWSLIVPVSSELVTTSKNTFQHLYPDRGLPQTCHHRVEDDGY